MFQLVKCQSNSLPVPAEVMPGPLLQSAWYSAVTKYRIVNEFLIWRTGQFCRWLTHIISSKARRTQLEWQQRGETSPGRVTFRLCFGLKGPTEPRKMTLKDMGEVIAISWCKALLEKVFPPTTQFVHQGILFTYSKRCLLKCGFLAVNKTFPHHPGDSSVFPGQLRSHISPALCRCSGSLHKGTAKHHTPCARVFSESLRFYDHFPWWTHRKTFEKMLKSCHLSSTECAESLPKLEIESAS